MPIASTVQRAGCFSASSPSILSPTVSSLTMMTVRSKLPVLFSEGLKVPPVLPDMQDAAGGAGGGAGGGGGEGLQVPVISQVKP